MWKLYVSCSCKLVECRVTPCWTLLLIRISICWLHAKYKKKYLPYEIARLLLSLTEQKLLPPLSVDVNLPFFTILFFLDCFLSRCVVTDFAEAEEPAFVIWAAIEAVCAGTLELRGSLATWKRWKKIFILKFVLDFYFYQCCRMLSWQLMTVETSLLHFFTKKLN